MRIAYVTTYDATDVHAWSGVGNFIWRALQGAGMETERIGNLRDGDWQLSRIKKLYYSKLRRTNFLRDREPAVLKSYAAQVERRMAPMNPDMIFSPGTVPIAYLKTKTPIAFWTDTTFAGMLDFYPSHTNLCAESIRQGNKMEQMALSSCRLAIYASEWAANSALQNYDVDPAKVKVVPFGANIEREKDLSQIEEIVAGKSLDTCKLLFLGVDWQRKGGDKALAVAERLNRLGLKTELHVAGCVPPHAPSPLLRNHGFISKKTEEGRKYLDRLFRESHFLILPSLAECFGVVFSEASSYGLPSLATRVGGIPTAVHDGKNGRTFDLSESPEEYCKYIQSVMASRESYRALSLSSFHEYSDRLNWRVAGATAARLMQEVCN
jgi:glycosyltransferase involved in cell wall biosynthesis